jgi:iron complex transport system permease protein
MQKKYLLIYLSLFIATVFLFLLDIALGSVNIPIGQVPVILFGGETENEVWQNIILHFRLPRAVAAVLVGASLGLSGLQMQTLFRNPLAGPFVLGISSGASLGVALLVLASYGIAGTLISGGLGGWIMVIAAFSGAMGVFILVMAVSYRVRDSMSLLIIGIMLGSITGAIVGALQYFSDAEQIQIYLIWTLGSLGGLTWSELQIFIPVIIIGLAIASVLFKPLNAMLLGDNYARSMGVKLKRSRALIIISTSLLAGTVTAFCGPIAFIGLAVPHITRLVLNTGDHKWLIPAAAGIGSVLMLFCDMISQLPGREEVLPINIVTSIVGAPVVIWIIMRKRAVKNSLTW